LPYGQFRDGSAGSVFNYVFFVQTFELAHQRRRRTENAAAGLERTRWTIQQAELQNVSLTVQLYFAALYQDGLRELAWITAKLNDDLLGVVTKRFDAGNASAADVALVRLDAASTRRQAELADIARDNALRALRRQLNLSADVPLRLDARLADFQWHPVSGEELCRLVGSTIFSVSADRDQLVGELAAGRPDVLAARAGVEAANANLRLAQASRVPNVVFGPYYQRDASATLNIGFQAEMLVPIVNTGMPLVRQRQAELQQQAVTFGQLEARARVETSTALERYEQARLLCDKDRDLTPSLPEELQKLEEQFKKGDVDILRVFQARTSLVQMQRAFLDSLNELAQAAAALTAASGLPPAALVGP
jgi:outer membrane protein TolC